MQSERRDATTVTTLVTTLQTLTGFPEQLTKRARLALRMSCPKCDPGANGRGRTWMLLVAAVIVSFTLLASR